MAAMTTSRTADFTPKLLSILREGYDSRALRADAVAGLTVAIVALPLSLALGIASGGTPTQGLWTAIIAGFLISAFGGSRVQIGGPTAAFVVIVFNIIARHGYDGMLLATILAGLILIAAGYLRVGQFLRYIPQPVVTGFTAGIAVTIAIGQLKDFFGLDVPHAPAEALGKLAAYGRAWASLNMQALAVGLGTLGLILSLKRLAPRAPGYLIAIATASTAVFVLNLDVTTIGARFGAIEASLPDIRLPDLTLDKLQAVVPAAFTIAFLAGVEALLSAVVSDGMTGFRHRSNQELIGQGIANLGSALFGGLPATGALARTATNVRAGGRSPVAGMLHALFLLLMMFIAAPLIGYVPLAALAAILLIVAWGMSEIKRFRLLLQAPLGDRVLLLATFVLTVLIDLTVAIEVGVVGAALMFMHRMAGAVGIEADPVEDSDQRGGLPAGVEVFRINGPMFFGAAGEVLEALGRIGRTPRVFILRLGLVPMIDASGAAALEAFVERCQGTGVAVIVSGVQPGVADVLERLGLGARSGRLHHAPNFAAAREVALGLLAESPAAG